MQRSLSVLFDLDGTLVDSVEFILASVRHTFSDRDHRPSEADWIAGIGTPLRSQLAAYAADGEDLERLVDRYRAHQRANHDAMMRSFAGAHEVLAEIRADGHRVGVVTGKLAEPAARALRHVGLAPMVDVVVGADDCERHKPDPDPILHALARMGGEPGAAMYIGDSPHDITAGNAAGVVTAAVLWGACTFDVLSAARPHHVVARLEDIPPLVRSLARS